MRSIFITSRLLAGTHMATAADSVAGAAVEKPKPTVIEGMDSRKMFDSLDAAADYLNSCADKFSDFGEIKMVLNGIDDEGNLDPAIYTPETRVMVALLANRGEKVNGKTLPSTAKAIVVTPAPTLEAILADDAARNWLVSKVLDKELNHIAVRQLRTADPQDIDEVKKAMPLTIADFISSSRESTGGAMETFNALFKGLIAAVGKKSAAWAKRRLVKTDLKKALESKAYAMEYFPELEDRDGKPSLFVMAAMLGKRTAEEQKLDPSIFDKWLSERDTRTIRQADASDDAEEDFDLADLAFDAPAETQPEATAEVDPAATAA